MSVMCKASTTEFVVATDDIRDADEFEGVVRWVEDANAIGIQRNKDDGPLCCQHPRREFAFCRDGGGYIYVGD